LFGELTHSYKIRPVKCQLYADVIAAVSVMVRDSLHSELSY